MLLDFDNSIYELFQQDNTMSILLTLLAIYLIPRIFYYLVLYPLMVLGFIVNDKVTRTFPEKVAPDNPSFLGWLWITVKVLFVFVALVLVTR
jgi:hypothetical protein